MSNAKQTYVNWAQLNLKAYVERMVFHASIFISTITKLTHVELLVIYSQIYVHCSGPEYDYSDMGYVIPKGIGASYHKTKYLLSKEIPFGTAACPAGPILKSLKRFSLTLPMSTNNSEYLDLFRTDPS